MAVLLSLDILRLHPQRRSPAFLGVDRECDADQSGARIAVDVSRHAVNLINGGTPPCNAITCGSVASCYANAGATHSTQTAIKIITYATTGFFLSTFFDNPGRQKFRISSAMPGLMISPKFPL